MRGRPIIAAACGLGLTIAACGGDAGSDTTAEVSAPTAAEASAAEPADAGDALPDNLRTEPDEPEQAAATEPDAPAPAPANDAVVPALLQFSAPLVGGGNIDAANLAGKPTVFWFWSPT